MPRIAAWSVLRSGEALPERAIERVCDERELDSRDRALVRTLVLTEIRRRGTLRAILERFERTDTKPDFAAILRLGLVQLLFLDRIPVHAAVDQTVGASGAALGPGKARAANAILRNVLRARREGRSGDPRCDLVLRNWHFDGPVFRDPATHSLLWASDALSFPAPLLKRWIKRYGRERAEELAVHALKEPRLALRVMGGEREAAIAELRAAGLDATPAEHPRAIICGAEDTGAVLASRLFSGGAITIQGPHAQRAAELVQARPGERILDLCAAPGGKSMLLAASGAQVVACDLDPERLSRIGSAAQRLGLDERITLVASDGTRSLAPGLFDAVLVDAPCSNTGVLSARPSAKWRFGPSELRSLVELQRRLIEEGAARVAPRGRLVWSTCSLEPEENAQLLRAFLGAHAEFALEEELTTLPDPLRSALDGGCAARLVRER